MNQFMSSFDIARIQAFYISIQYNINILPVGNTQMIHFVSGESKIPGNNKLK